MLHLQVVIASTRPTRVGPIIAYGGVSAGVRSVSMTKEIVTALKMMPMFETVALPFFAQHLDREKGTFSPPAVQDEAASVMLDELHRWATALEPLRAPQLNSVSTD